jgi:DNA-binding FadR family transcriptional regulator
VSATPTSREPAGALDVHRIEPAYRQVATQIRTLVLEGTLVPGERLPAEDKLAASFGVSRGTVREALRMLVSEGLARTTRGVAGGTFVTAPQPAVLQDQLETGLGLLSGAHAIDTDELYEARLSIEVPCSRWAAERRTDEHLERMRRSAWAVEQSTNSMSRADSSHDFHQAVVDASGNRLLSVIAPPIWRAFRRSALQTGGAQEAWHGIDDDHVAILQHIERSDADGAAEAMRAHLGRLRESNL